MSQIVLDVTRTISPKSIVSPTGVDRVERAYIRHFLKRGNDVQFICRLGSKQALIGAAKMRELMDRIEGRVPWGRRDMRGVFRGLKGQIEADIRRLASAVEPSYRLFGHIVEGAIYINVGHTNLDKAFLTDLRVAGVAKIVGLVHDMIPVDFPEYQTPASVARFTVRIKELAAQADLIIANSEYTAARVSHWFDAWGSKAEILPNHLGVESPLDVAPHVSARPYFVQLGTIEPRKNHRLLLEVWQRFQNLSEQERPILHIIGRNGWLNDDVMKMLADAPYVGRDVFVHDAMSDADVTSFLKGSNALLFPSFAEGFGFPLLEAVQLGVPVIASDIPAFREFDAPLSLYLKSTDVHTWQKTIIEHKNKGLPELKTREPRRDLVPNWDDHFERLEQRLSYFKAR